MVRQRDLLYEPPMLKQLTSQEVQVYIDVPFSTVVHCHSQAVERTIKLTSSKQNLVGDKKDGAAKSRITQPALKTLLNYQ